MGNIKTTIKLVGGKSIVKTLSSIAFESFCQIPGSATLLSNVTSEITDKLADYVVNDDKNYINDFRSFQELLNKLILDSINEVQIDDEWYSIDLLCFLNHIEIPREYTLGDGLEEYLCREYERLTPLPCDDDRRKIFHALAPKYKRIFWQHESEEKVLIQAIDEKESAQDKEIVQVKRRISVLESNWKKSSRNINAEQIKAYYSEKIIETVERKEKEESILGSESLLSAYIPAKTTDKGQDMKLAVYKWFRETQAGVLLLYGDPGHGKTSFCQKFVYDYVKENPFAFRDAEVLLFPLLESEKFSLSSTKNLIHKYSKSC